MKIASKISFSFLIVAILVSSVASSITYFISKVDLQRAIDGQLEITAALKKNQIETYLELIRASVNQLSRSTILEIFIKAHDKNPSGSSEVFAAAMKRLRRTKEANPSIAAFLLLDTSGKVIVSSNPDDVGKDKSNDAFFISGQKGTYIKDIYYAPELKRGVFAASTPFLDSENNQLLGVLVAQIELKELNDIVSDTTGLGKTGEAYLVNKYGYMITPSRFLKNTFLRQRVDSLNLNYCLQNYKNNITQPEIIVCPNYRGVEVMGANGYLPLMQWSVLSEVSTQEALAPLERLRFIFIFILIAVPIAAWFLGTFLSRLITASLERLQKAVKKVKDGNFDYRVAIYGKDEVGQLARSFDIMSENLKNTTTSLEDLNKEIDERKRIEMQLRDSKEWFSTTLGSIGDGVIATDKDGLVTFMNKIAQNLTGWDGEEAKLMHLSEVFKIINEETHKAADNPVDKVIRTGAIVGLGNHTLLIAKDGKELPIDDSAAPIKNNQGEIIGVVLVFRDVTARRKMENDLRRLAAILEFSDEGIIGKSLDGIIFSWNKGAEKIYGYKPEEMIGRGVSILVPPGNKDDSMEILEKIKKGESIDRYETERITKCGVKINVSLTVSPIVNNLNQIIGASVIAHDITQDKKTQELIRESEERFRQLFESSRDAIMIMDRAGFIDCNNKTLELFAIREKETFIKKHPSELSPPFQPDGSDSFLEANKHIERAFKEGTDLFEWKHQKIDGKVFSTEVLLSKFILAEKEYLQATVRDITWRKEAEQQIRLAAEEWERTFNSISDLIFIQDKDFKIMRVNKSCCEALKLKPAEIVGRKCHEILHNLNHPWPNCPAAKTQGDQLSHTEEVDDPHIGVPLLVTVSPIFNARGEFVGSVHVAHDISERKKVENALRKVIELKTDFTSTVSHELRTPLAAIKEGISIVLDGTSGVISKEQKEFLHIAKRNVDRLARIINDILDFQKLESGKMSFNMRANDINSVASEVAETMRMIIEQKGLVLALEFDKELPKIQFDRDRITQVLTNLMNNAVKFTEKGRIEIHTARVDNFIKVSVKDTGVGIKDSDIPLLFERFKQLDSGMSRKTGGTGLGLSICKEIVEKHNGKIWVESKFGEGSTFGFSLPLI